jgi:hypothetical protein
VLQDMEKLRGDAVDDCFIGDVDMPHSVQSGDDHLQHPITAHNKEGGTPEDTCGPDQLGGHPAAGPARSGAP